MRCLIMCRGLTAAQRVASVLGHFGIGAYQMRAPENLSIHGCTYAVQVSSHQLRSALNRMREYSLPITKVYCQSGEGYSEAAI